MHRTDNYIHTALYTFYYPLFFFLFFFIAKVDAAGILMPDRSRYTLVGQIDFDPIKLSTVPRQYS